MKLPFATFSTFQERKEYFAQRTLQPLLKKFFPEEIMNRPIEKYSEVSEALSDIDTIISHGRCKLGKLLHGLSMGSLESGQTEEGRQILRDVLKINDAMDKAVSAILEARVTSLNGESEANKNDPPEHIPF